MNDQRERDLKDAVAYVAAFKEQRPRLEPLSKCDPMVQRVYASMFRRKWWSVRSPSL